MIAAKPVDFQFYNHPIADGAFNSGELEEVSFTRRFPYGVLEFKEWRFDGIMIRHTRNNFNDHYHFENKNTIHAVGLEFNLRGAYDIFHINRTYRVRSRQHNIIYTPDVHNTFCNRDLQGETFKIYFLPDAFLRMVRDSNDTLKRFAESVMRGIPAVVAQVSPLVDPDLYRLIQEIIHCRFKGGLKKVFLLSKCMEILVMQAEAFNKAAHGTGSTAGKSVTDQMYFARDYLIQRIDNPPTLSELAKAVGVNEYKLKKTFRETFHTTVFGYLSDYRLEKARKMLLKKNKSASEIAYELGYSSPQHFSGAYKKKFGVSPRSTYKEARGC